jgi:hypothetical protein
MLVRLVLVASLSLAALTSVALRARADERRDYMLEGDKPGDKLVLDYFGTGGQLTLVRRRPIYGNANEYTTGVTALVGYPLAQLTAAATLRILFLEFGGSIGYRTIWRNLTFKPGEDTYCVDCDRAARRELDPILGKGPDTDRYVFAEGRVQLYAPFNEHFVLTSLLAARYEGSKPREYDWFFTDIHDGGVITRWETLAFFKHRDLGGIGPYLQLMVLPRAGKHETEFAYGFNAVTRLGLIDRDDLLFFTFLMRPNDPYYGQHSYFLPVRALLIYRITLSL